MVLRRIRFFNQVAGLSESHISALFQYQRNYGREMKNLGQMKSASLRESKRRGEMGPEHGLSPEARWQWWVFRKVRMRAFSEMQKILHDLKRDRQAEKER